MPEDLDIWMTQARDRGDREAFARVVESCHHLLRAIVLRETADPELSDELVQDAFVRAWSKRDQYRPGTSPRSWLITITRSRLMEHLRRQDRDRRHLRDLVRKELLRHNDGAEQEDLNAGLRREALQNCLRELGDRQRELLDLVHGQGLTTESVADMLGIKAPACRQRLSRLQRALRRCVESRVESI